MITVTLHNDQITLKSCGSTMGSNWCPQAWDTVNVVVHPAKITLDTLPRISSSPVPGRKGEKSDPVSDVRVWLKGQITQIGYAQEGTLVSLLIGSAQGSVFIDREEDGFRRWISGMAVEIHVDRHDAWLKPRGSDCAPIFCGILYLDHHSIAGSP